MTESFQAIVCHSEHLNENESREIEEVSHLAFTGPEDEIDWSPPEWYVLGKMKGQVVSVVGILKRRIRVGEISLDVGGIGGVATHPDHQKQGFGSALLQSAAEFIHQDLHIDFGLLLCAQETVTFYSKLGWKIAEEEMIFECQEPGFDGITMVLPLGGRPWPKGTIDLCGPPW